MRPTKTIEQCIIKDFSVDKIKTSEYQESGDFAVIDQGKDLIAGYYSGNKQIYNGELPTIIYGDHTNIVKYIDFPFICGADGVKVLTPKNDIYAKYFYYVLNCVKPETQGYRRHYPLLKNIQIPLPPLETQKAIVAKLDQIFAELDQTKSEIQKNLDNTDELRKSALNQAFQGDWEMKKLGEVCENIFAGGDKPKNFSEEQNEKYKIPVYANGVDKDGLVGFTDVARVNDICLTVSGRGTIGFPVIRENPFVPIVRLIVAIPNKDLNIKYLWYSVLGIDFNDTGVAIPQLTVPRFKEHMITVPPLSEQEKIVEHLDQVSKEVKALKSQYQSQLDNLEELKKSVLDKAFRGELG